ncbi:MAG TPA: SOS response-associated peptidase [Longimicrobiales bacterium]|nr:SOS response-associated peptidase [Longimicrobiales bacterium]
MCGRYTLAASTEELVEELEVPWPSFALEPRYNIAPSQDVPVVAEDRHGRRVGLLTWGLVPGWADEPGAGIINARGESVADKPSFREAFERRRCLVPADGFYEWRKEGGSKIPYWIHPPGGGLISFAGIWERWGRAGAEPRHTLAIITTNASEDVAEVHDRMPVVVAPPDRGRWLARSSEHEELIALLRPAPRGSLARRQVSPRVNRPAEDDVGLIEPVAVE